MHINWRTYAAFFFDGGGNLSYRVGWDVERILIQSCQSRYYNGF